MEVQKSLPRYKCFKVVGALKIKSIDFDGLGGARITPMDDGYPSFAVSPGYMQKHRPQAGGYYVRYADGYESWSPSDVFESGYDLIKD